MAIDVKLPNLGEGIDSADVLSVLVSPGELVAKDQDLLEIETDKATAEVPSPEAGKVVQIHVSAGQAIQVGQLLVTLEAVSAESSSAAADVPPSADKPKKAGGKKAGAKQADAKKAGAKKADPPLGPIAGEAPLDRREPPRALDSWPTAPAKSVPPSAPPAAGGQDETSSAGSLAGPGAVVKTPDSAPVPPLTGGDESIPAGPAIRRLAREVGIDLGTVVGSGHGGRITRDDVLAAVRAARGAAATAATEPAPPAAAGPGPASVGDSGTSDLGTGDSGTGDSGTSDAWGPVRIERMTKIRKTIAATMHASWSTIPRVTNFDDADVTELEAVRQKSKVDYAAAGIKLTLMPFVIKAIALSLKAHPTLNASIDMEAGTICYKDYVNIGIAVDTERGLVVPSLRNADRLCLADISRSLVTIAENSRTSSFSIEDLRGSTFTISNLGAIGGTYSTPIINPPEVAVMLIGRSRKTPVVVDDQVAVRLMLPLRISNDHRLVDGAAAARFLNDVKGYLEVPSRLLLAP
jgi:pyruvate dehydrogenase E2 component (dihydrolipoamide acetyltransferase)